MEITKEMIIAIFKRTEAVIKIKYNIEIDKLEIEGDGRIVGRVIYGGNRYDDDVYDVGAEELVEDMDEYAKIWEEEKRIAEEERRQREIENEKRMKEENEKREKATYLRLKKKYEK